MGKELVLFYERSNRGKKTLKFEFLNAIYPKSTDYLFDNLVMVALNMRYNVTKTKTNIDDKIYHIRYDKYILSNNKNIKTRIEIFTPDMVINWKKDKDQVILQKITKQVNAVVKFIEEHPIGTRLTISRPKKIEIDEDIEFHPIAKIGWN